MKRLTNLFLLVAVLLQFGGCRVCRNIEQWKCDKMGMCHFGITPTVQPMGMPGALPYPTAPAIYPPEPMGNSVQISPPYPQSYGVPMNNSSYVPCQK